MTEREIAKVFKLAFLEQGADGYRPNGLDWFNIRAWLERLSMADSIPQDRKIQKGDLLLLDLGASYRGYKGHTAQYAFIGEPSEKHKKVDRLIACIQEAIAEFLRPGIRGSDVQKHVTETVTAAGLSFSEFEFASGGFPVGGICTGLNAHEHPRISVGMEDSTEAGLCITMTC